MLPAFAGAEGTFSYTLTAGGTEVEESEPLGQKVHMFDPDIPNSLPAGAQWGNADDPEWQCTLARNMDKDFYDKPVHCQKAYHEEKWLTTYVEKKGNPTAIEQPASITATVRGETARTISNNVGTLTRKPSNEPSSANSNGNASGPILESSIPSDPDVDLENQSVTVRGGGPYPDDSFVEAGVAADGPVSLVGDKRFEEKKRKAIDRLKSKNCIKFLGKLSGFSIEQIRDAEMTSLAKD